MKLGKTKEKGGAAYEASSYFIERDIDEKWKMFILQLISKAQRGIRGIALLFLALDGIGGQPYPSAILPLGWETR